LGGSLHRRVDGRSRTFGRAAPARSGKDRRPWPSRRHCRQF
jgi:hypothetical protein